VPSTPFPVWAIVLIALGGVTIIGAGIAFCIKKKKERDVSNGLTKYDTLSQ